MIVCICEKPSVALEVAKVLGARTKKDGYYEGNGYQVTWTFGHLCELKSPDKILSSVEEVEHVRVTDDSTPVRG